MLAELRGKLSTESSQDLERLEDLLTDYVFGALKYLPREALAAVLLTTLSDLSFPEADLAGAEFLFWPTFGDTEPDVVILVGRQPIVVEAKLGSGFGLGDAPGENQLVREYRRALEWSIPRRLAAPVVLAVTAGFGEPEEIAVANALLDNESHGPFPVRWCSWQRIAAAIEGVHDELDHRGQELAADLLRVMERRGVRRMFEGFDIEDYWLMAAAQRRASAVVFPTVATFCKDLLERLGEHGVRGEGGGSIVSHGSGRLDRPERWGLRYLYLPMWPDIWPKRQKWSNATLFVQFSLREPEVWVGYRHQVRTQQQDAWDAAADEIAIGVSAQVGRTAGASRYPDYHDLFSTREASQVDSAWLRSILPRTEVFFSLHRALPLEALSQTAAVVDMVREDQEYVESIPFLLGDGLPKP